MGKSRFCYSILAASMLGACATTPSGSDLTVGALDVAPVQTTAGSPITINSSIDNSGLYETQSPAAMAIDLFVDPATGPIAPLTAWRQGDGETLAPGASAADIARIRMPLNIAPGNYSVCAIADPDNEIAEANEANNRECAPVEILAGAPRAADLIIENVSVIKAVDASLKLRVRIRNAGALPTDRAFRIMAFARHPRTPLVFVDCPVSQGQLSAGSPISCGYVVRTDPIAPGQSADIDGYFAFAIEGAGRFPINWIGPGEGPARTRRTIDFMVDGCFPPLDGSRVECVIDEIDELNNFKSRTLKTR
ncbi:MAG: hypothetical protein KDD85_04080 [Parvularculaceae bacterium]|nr:hypothetical protein [Parvularculaceae bacterium]